MCLPTANRPTSLDDDFSSTQIDMTKWSEVFGGSVGTTCSLPGNGNSLYFNQPGIRKAVTVDLEMTMAMLVACVYPFVCVRACVCVCVCVCVSAHVW